MFIPYVCHINVVLCRLEAYVMIIVKSMLLLLLIRAGKI